MGMMGMVPPSMPETSRPPAQGGMVPQQGADVSGAQATHAAPPSGAGMAPPMQQSPYGAPQGAYAPPMMPASSPQGQQPPGMHNPAQPMGYPTMPAQWN